VDMTWSVALTVVCGRDDAEVARRANAIGRRVDELRERHLAGTPAEIVDKMGRYAALGVTRFYLQVLDLQDLEHIEFIAAEVAPQV
jgi:alkanesulfonate monooxygenase SsuD/methylene tetrahydromethanopterin reductase-like flavin-dependent oxidoreductase (luciferase family)